MLRVFTVNDVWVVENVKEIAMIREPANTKY